MDAPVLETLGLRVVALREGRMAGFISRVYLNPGKRRISGFIVRDPRLGAQENWVDVQDVRALGENVVLIDRADACKAKIPVGRNLRELMGLPVTSLDGHVLGSLIDVQIGNDWELLELEITEGRTVAIDPKSTVVGRDAILLRKGATAEVHPTPHSNIGLLAKVFGHDTIQEIARAISRAERAALPLLRKAARRSHRTGKDPSRR